MSVIPIDKSIIFTKSRYIIFGVLIGGLIIGSLSSLFSGEFDTFNDYPVLIILVSIILLYNLLT